MLFCSRALQCFASLHICKRSKALQGRWTERGKDQKITNGVSFIVQSLPPVDLYLISEKSIWKNQVRKLDF